jgi:putative endonuclease
MVLLSVHLRKNHHFYSMASHNITGREGEALAAAWLVGQGFRLLHQNWRHARWEVDIIAEKNGVLHFIEVKTLRSQRFGYPEQRVNHQKLGHIKRVAEHFLRLYPQWQRIQFDILAITLQADGTADYYWMEDVS